MNFLQSKLGPFPVWVWGVVIIAGVGVFLLVRRFHSPNSSGGTLGQNPAGQVNPLNPTNDPALDPNTGIPYQIEEAIDPNTGLPYYIELTSGATSPGQAGGGPQGPTGPIPPGPGPSTGPGTAPGTAPSTVTAVAGNQYTVPAARPGFGPIPPQPGPGGGTDPHGPPQPGPGARPGFKPIPPVPGPHGTGEPGEEWNYPFWIGQGGSLYARGA